MKKGKKYVAVASKVDSNKLYSIEEACTLVKETSTVKFDATVDVSFRLNIDPKYADQQLRGTIALPHGNGKTKKILAITRNHEAAKEAGVSDEDKDKAFEAYANMLDDAIRNKVSKETWLMFIKGINHDKDVAEAADEGEVRGRNTKIVEKLKKPTTATPPMITGQGAEAPKRKFGGVLDNLSTSDWY